MRERVTLPGCSPTPLASYLKALGVLRLLSSGENNVKGEPADPGVRGWWEDETFHLLTTLGPGGVADFFLHDYAPSPIIAPWNGGSGFYPKDNKSGFSPLTSGPVAERFRPLAMAIRSASDTLQFLHLGAPPSGGAKAKASKERLVAALRARLPASSLPWLDAALVLSADGLRFPELLGTGGNDGRLDFTNNLMRRLFSRSKPFGIFDAFTGDPSPTGTRLLDNALFATAAHELTGVKVGQYMPGGAGGPNASTGYSGGPTVNPWDYVLMLAGATTFASAATRRYQSNAMRSASFPFTVRTSGAGWGGMEAADETEARAEFWAPLWGRPARFCEVEALFGEGRAVTNGQTASDGLEFARSLATLGVSRGFSEFQRYGFFKRAGNTHYAAPIGRKRAAVSRGAELVSDLDIGAWLARARRFGRDGNHPASVRSAVKRLEDSLFDLLAPDSSSNAVRSVLVSIGRLCEWLGNSPKGRDAVPPPPLLSHQWLRRADDGTPEFRVAAALAGLGLPSWRSANGSGRTDSVPADSRAPPMAAHLAPLTNSSREGFERGTFFHGSSLRRRRRWAGTDNPPTVVWGHGGLVANMIGVLERRLVDVSIRGLCDKPFGSASFARLADIAAFLASEFDDARCSELLAGMVWARPAWLQAAGRADQTDATDHPREKVPFAYAALKPIFSTDRALRRVEAIPTGASVPMPPGLVARLRAAGDCRDGRAIGPAVFTAFSRARSSGLPSPYDPVTSGGGASALRGGRIGAGIRPDRLAAAMLIPISNRGLASLLRRAYPGTILDTVFHPQEESSNVD